MVLACSLSRCITWIASIAILFVLKVLLIRDHLSVKFIFTVGALVPFTFRVARVIFALFPVRGLVWVLYGCLGIGLRGVPLAMLHCLPGGAPGSSSFNGHGTGAWDWLCL